MAIPAHTGSRRFMPLTLAFAASGRTLVPYRTGLLSSFCEHPVSKRLALCGENMPFHRSLGFPPPEPMTVRGLDFHSFHHREALWMLLSQDRQFFGPAEDL